MAIARPRHPAGFTLIELLVVIGVLALLGGLAAPWFASVGDAVRFRSALRALAADLREVRGSAIRSGQPAAVAFDPAGRGYAVAGGPAVALPPDLALRWGGAAPLGFFPDGTSTGGELWVGGPRHAARLAVAPLTGQFSIAVAP